MFRMCLLSFISLSLSLSLALFISVSIPCRLHLCRTHFSFLKACLSSFWSFCHCTSMSSALYMSFYLLSARVFYIAFKYLYIFLIFFMILNQPVRLENQQMSNYLVSVSSSFWFPSGKRGQTSRDIIVARIFFHTSLVDAAHLCLSSC